MLNDYKSTAQNRTAPKVAIMVISRPFNSLIFMCDIHRLLFDKTIIVNEAQVPPTGLVCEV